VREVIIIMYLCSRCH